ncbi:MAG: hypothetical protein Q9161_003121 [Pseudevernia consocians]
MRFIHPTFLLSFLSSLSSVESVCLDPPPAPSLIPHLQDCYDVIQTIFALSESEHNEPLLWSRDPPAGVRSQTLPYSFTHPTATNDCEFIVDTITGKEGEEDTFQTIQVARRARDIVRKCMVRGVDGRASLGAGVVGPKRVIVVVLSRKIPASRDGDDVVLGLNRTEGMLLLGLNGSSIQSDNSKI